MVKRNVPLNAIIIVLVLLTTSLSPIIEHPVNAQNQFTAEFDPESTVGPKSEAEAPVYTDLRLYGDVGEFVYINSSSINRSLLQKMYGGNRTVSGVRVAVPANNTINTTLPSYFDCHPESYEFNISNGNMSTSATLYITEYTERRLPGRVEIKKGDTAIIPIDIDQCGYTEISIEDPREENIWRIRLVGSGDERVDLLFDTSSANKSRLSVRNDAAEVVSVSNNTGQGTLQTGTYTMYMRGENGMESAGELTVLDEWNENNPTTGTTEIMTTNPSQTDQNSQVQATSTESNPTTIPETQEGANISRTTIIEKTSREESKDIDRPPNNATIGETQTRTTTGSGPIFRNYTFAMIIPLIIIYLVD